MSNHELRDWPQNGSPRRAGVSSLGVGGTNAHIVLEEAPELEPSSESRDWQLLQLSAKTKTLHLDAASQNLATFLRENPDVPLADVAYTLQVGRQPMAQRRVLWRYKMPPMLLRFWPLATANASSVTQASG